MIVPVWQRHETDQENTILVYAVLDDQSDTTFVSQGSLNKLGIEGHATQISLSTVHAADEIIQTSKVSGLLVSHFNRSTEIPLPRAFSCSDIPVRRSHIPRPEMAAKWDHLAIDRSELFACNRASKSYTRARQRPLRPANRFGMGNNW